MSSFEEIGLREELLRTLEEEEITEPTALQAAVLPSLRRGGNLIARAGSGAGKTLAYGLGVLDNLEKGEADEGPLALVLTATPEEARRVAIRLAPFAQATGVSVSALGSGWGVPAAEAGIVVAAATDAMEAVKVSSIKLEQIQSLVIDGASDIQEFGGWSDIDSLLDLVPRGAQRALLTGEWNDEIEDMADRRIKKALRYPAGRSGSPPAVEATLTYVVVGAENKLELLASQLRSREAGGPPPLVFTRSDERTAELAEQLAGRGFLVGAPGDEDSDVTLVESGLSRSDLLDEQETLGQTISFDVPADVDSLKRRHGGDEAAVVMVYPRQVGHLRQVAADAGFKAQSAPLPSDTTAVARGLRSFRADLARAIREEDLTAQMLVLEPLLDEFSAIEVAAALASMLRSKRPIRPIASVAEPISSDEPLEPSVEKSAPAGPAPVTWTRLYVGVGSKEEVRPGDLVGALAGEADIPGSKIGKIEIRDSFSVVEVEAAVAEKVIRAVNGTTIKGRAVRVDYDRGGPARRPGSDRAPRGADRGGDRGGRGGPRGESSGRGAPRGGSGSRGPDRGGPRGEGGGRGPERGGAGGDRGSRGPARGGPPRRSTRRPPSDDR